MKKDVKISPQFLLWLEAFLLTFLFLGIIYIKCGVYFETNDDRIINEILTGINCGMPDGHAIFVNYILGAVLAALYSVAGNIPWYGMFLIFSHFAVYWSFWGLLFEKCENIYQHFLAMGCGVFFILTNIYIFAEMQYTSTAAILATGGYLWLVLDEKRKRGYVLFFIFESLALLLRSQAMLMIQPIGAVVFLASLLCRWGKRGGIYKEIVQDFLKYGTVLLTCFFVAVIGNYCLGDYGNSEWKEYKHFKEVQEQIADYYGFPGYEEVEHILNKYDVSLVEYRAFIRYWMVGNDIDIACLEEICEFSKTKYQDTRSNITEIMELIWNERRYAENAGYGIYTQRLYVLAFVLFLVGRQWKMYIPLLGLNVSHNVVLGYLLYRGRLPFRVLSGLYFIEILFLLVWIFQVGKKIQGKKIVRSLVVGVCVLAVMLTCIDTVRSTYYKVCNMHQQRAIFSLGMDEIISYCMNSDSGYVIVNEATTYYTGEVLNTDWYQKRNWISSGGWWYSSPNIATYQKHYYEENKGNMRLIEMGKGMDPGASYAYALFTEDWGYELSFVEEIKLSSGVVLEVYDIKECVK